MAESGQKNKIYVVTSGPVYTIVGEGTSNSVSISGEVVDITSKDSDWAKNFIGTKSWEVSGSFYLDKSSPIHQELKVGTSVNILMGEVLAGSVVYGISGSANISSVNISADNNAGVTLEITFNGNGEMTYHNATTTTTTA